MKIIRDAFLIAVIASAFGLAVNAGRLSASKGGLPLGTPWPDNRKIVALETPPSYQIGDSLLSLEDAYTLYLKKDVIFIDAREQGDYHSGHVKGAINLPFEEWDAHWAEVEPQLSKEIEIVAYCGGLDCELSLFMTRELKQLGYEKSYIFFGGWQKWQDAGLPVELLK